jgi:hypothetical protein
MRRAMLTARNLLAALAALILNCPDALALAVVETLPHTAMGTSFSLARKDGESIDGSLSLTIVENTALFETSTTGNASAFARLAQFTAFEGAVILFSQAGAQAGDGAVLLSVATARASHQFGGTITNTSGEGLDLLAGSNFVLNTVLHIDPFSFSQVASAVFLAEHTTPFFNETFSESFTCSGPEGTIGTTNCDNPLLFINRQHEFFLPAGASFDFGVSYNYLYRAVSVPEPPTLALLSIALAGLGFARRRKLD